MNHTPSPPPAESFQKVDKLIQAIEDVYPSTRQLIWKSFLRGIFMGLGTTIGASIVLGIITYTVSQLRLVPGLNEFIEQIRVEEVLGE